MAWVRIDDAAHMHPKFMALADDAAIALWWRAIGYCNHHRTGGFVAEGALRLLSLAADPTTLAAKLVKVGLWEVAEDGFRFHHYDHYQGTREQTEEAKRAVSPARQEAGRRGGQRSGEARRAKLDRSQREASAKPDEALASSNRSANEASAKPDEAPGSSRASDPGSDPVPGSQSRSDLNPTHSAGAGERFEQPGAGTAKPAALPPAVEPDPRDADQPERAAMLAALRASPLLRAVADATALGPAAALGGLADQLDGMRAFGAKRLDVYLVAIDEAIRAMTSKAVGDGPPTWAVAAKQVTSYCANARPIRASQGSSRSSSSTLQQPAPEGATSWTVDREM